AVLHQLPLCLDLRSDTLHRLTVTRVGHAFAAADVFAGTDRRYHDDGFGPRAPRNREPTGDRPALHAHLEPHAQRPVARRESAAPAGGNSSAIRATMPSTPNRTGSQAGRPWALPSC